MLQRELRLSCKLIAFHYWFQLNSFRPDRTWPNYQAIKLDIFYDAFTQKQVVESKPMYHKAKLVIKCVYLQLFTNVQTSLTRFIQSKATTYTADGLDEEMIDKKRLCCIFFARTFQKPRA
ncbi:hypothetical protein B5X24_HaOG215954 [Helicoverpa armigera]|nr:hypothetical protein B5X24_HaOG215954 [Helicoverpa armigera]